MLIYLFEPKQLLRKATTHQLIYPFDQVGENLLAYTINLRLKLGKKQMIYFNI